MATCLTTLDDTARPRLARGVRLQPDPARGGHVLLAPERVVAANASAVAVLELCDGTHSLDAIADELARRYGAGRERIAADVRTLLANLAAKRLIDL
jgi:pyrroloquinoline quinone biosynthesis protein D